MKIFESETGAAAQTVGHGLLREAECGSDLRLPDASSTEKIEQCAPRRLGEGVHSPVFYRDFR